MFATLAEKLIAGGLLIATLLGAFGAYTFHERAEGKAAELVTLKKSSDKLTAAANENIAKLTAAHATALTKLEADHATQITAANAQHDFDTQRLRDADAYRRQHPAVQNPAQPAGTASAGNGSAGQDPSGIERLEQVSNGLADALRFSDAALTACVAERNSVASPLF